MHDGVAEVLAERARLDRGATLGIVVSVLLHGALAAALVYAATHASAPVPANVMNIQFANVQPSVAPAAPAGDVRPRAAAPTPEPKIEEKKPEIQEPKPVVTEPAKKAEKNTVPLDPFGRSNKKGSEKPAVEKPAPAPAPAAAPGPGAATAEVPVGGSGVTGLEGGDFPYALYIQSMQRRIGSNWFRPQVAAGTAVVIYFRIQRDGTISEAKVQTSSGNGTFDRAALSAVVTSSPLNPLPFAYDGTYLGVHLTFK